MKIELIEVEVQSEEGQQKWTFASIINGKEYQSEVTIYDISDSEYSFLQSILKEVIKQFDEFEKKN